MSDLVVPQDVQEIVGQPRQQSVHMGRAVSAEGRVYIMHSQSCYDQVADLRKCRYSKALDAGIDPSKWAAWQDRPVLLCVVNGELLPVNYRRNPERSAK